MTWNRQNRRLPRLMTFLAGAAVLVLEISSAQAQWGWGWGWGGFGGFNYTSSPTNFLNQWSLSNASRAGPPASQSPYAGNPNAYFNRVRDNGFVPHSDVRRRQPPTARPEPPPSLGDRPGEPTRPQSSPAAPRPKPVIPLSSFFDASQKLVWPSEAPVTGDLKEKRQLSDKASLAVLEEAKQHGVAPIATVADARQKLLDYGRPALQEVRASATPRVADTFHLFLLSLYESIAQAASPIETTSASPP
jgi:hypothetical protein